MKQIYNQINQLWKDADDFSHWQELKAARDRRVHAQTELELKTEHVFELTKSDEKTGKTKKMTGQQAKIANDKLFQDYLVQLDNNDENRDLFRWEKK